MRRTGWIALAAAVAIGALCWHRTGGRAAPAAPGTRYQLELAQRQSMQLGLGGGDAALDTDLALRGAIALGPIERDGDRRVRTLVVERVDALRVALAGHDLAATMRDALTGGRARLVLDDDGALVGVEADTGVPAVAQNLLRLIASELQVELHDGSAWTAHEEAHAGRAAVAYARDVADRRRVVKTRTGYDHVRIAIEPGAPVSTDGRARITLAAGDALDALDGLEHVIVGDPAAPLATVTTAVTLRRTGAVPLARAPAHWRPIALDRPVLDASIDDQLLRARIGTLDQAALTARILGFQTAEHDPDFPAFYWQATGLLVRDPDACRALAALARDPALDAVRRGLIADLLVGAGTAPAQAELRALWRDEVYPDDERRERGFLAARIGNLAAPEAATVEVFLRELDGPPGVRRQASMLAAGALAGAPQAGPESAAVRDQVMARLRDELQVEDPAARIDALHALHNAGRADALAAISEQAADPRADVRAAAALATRKIHDPRALALVAPLARDPDPRVQRVALESLRGQPLDAPAIRAVADAILDGTIGPTAWREALGFVRLAPPELRRALVQYMVPRATDAPTRDRLTQMLATT